MSAWLTFSLTFTLADLSAAYQQSKAELKATEKRLKDVNRQLRLLGQYFKTKAVYREYLKGGKRKDFAAAHRSELELYDAVVKELRELFGIRSCLRYSH